MSSEGTPPTAIDPALPLPFPSDSGTVVTVGTFDGVHRGHHEVLERLAARSRDTGLRSVLVTFDPHPLRVVRPESAPPLLSTLAEKKALLAESGLHAALFLAFTPMLMRYPAERFVDEILLDRLRMRELIIGYDHGFGQGRSGGADTLRRIGAERGFAVEVIGAVGADQGAFSSSRIRAALLAGDLAEAARMLGRPYALEGTVVHGKQHGRRLGFPTANIQIDQSEKLLPLEGIYTAYGWIDGERFPGLLHLGPRPTFAGYPPTVELHLLDWSGDLYGRRVQVEFHSRLRGVEKFTSAEALIAQMERDRDKGRRAFAGG